MKALTMVLVACVVLATACGNVCSAADKTDLRSEQKYAQAEANLLVGLRSDNLGVRESAAYLLGELKSTKAVIPLMSALRNAQHESTRIVAALALCRIGDARGVYAVKMAAQFDDDRSVQKRCAWFYNQYVSPASSGRQMQAYAAR